MDEVLTIEEAASYLRIEKKLLYRLIESGEIAAKKVGRVYRINKQVLVNYMNGETA